MLTNFEKSFFLLTSFCCLDCWLSTYFTPLPSISVAEFEQVNVCWGKWSNYGEIHAICAIYRLLFHILGIMT